MTLTEIADYCTAKIGITDNNTVDLAKTFIKARWAMIWNAATWRQSRMEQTVSVTAGTQDVTLDSNFEYPTAARWAGNLELIPTNDLSAFSTNPAAYDQTGTVAQYTQLPRDSSRNVVIRLLQKPDSTQNLLVIGKKKCPTLGDSDSPSLLGADETLCAFATGDLYQWLRQLGKAQMFFQEGTALLQKMTEIETAQVPEIRRIIPVEQVLDEDQPRLW